MSEPTPCKPYWPRTTQQQDALMSIYSADTTELNAATVHACKEVAP